MPEPRKHRRVTTPPVPGSDPEPQRSAEAVRAAEDADVSWGDRGGENDSRLIADKPPHWG